MTDSRALDDAVLLRLIVENLPDMIFVKDGEELRFVRFNRAGEQLLGWKRSELIGKNDYDFFPKEEADFFTTKDHDVLAGGRLVDIPEEPIHTAAHGLRWLHTKKIPILDERGRPLFLLGISRDITELREARVALEDRESRLRLLLENFPGLVWTADEELRLVSVAGARAAAVGLAEPAIEGADVADLLPGAEGGASVAELHRSALAGQLVSYEFHAAGLDFEARVEALAAAGRVRLMGVALDVTERRKLEAERVEAELQRAQRLEGLGILAGGIAHDFNNLLVGILGNASLALAKVPPDSAIRRNLEQLETAAERAAELTRQMLAYSGRARFVVGPVDLSATVREMAELIGTSISKQARLELSLAPGLPPVEADAAQLRQVVMNLLTNASDALRGEAGTIRVYSGLHDAVGGAPDFAGDPIRPGRYVVLEVADSGCGMDERTRRRMFDPFFTTKVQGHGLGLAATLGIIRAHRGAIRVASEPGHGTTIQVLLPALASSLPALAPEPGEAEKGQRAAGETGLVLVIDDEEAVLELIRSSLEFAGFEVLLAPDGETGLKLAAEHGSRIGVVLLDMTMPGMSGEKVFAKLRAEHPDVPVILSSGFNEQEALARFAGRGLAAFLQKPYRVNDLLARVRAHIRAPR